jgi:hypothetical protein
VRSTCSGEDKEAVSLDTAFFIFGACGRTLKQDGDTVATRLFILQIGTVISRGGDGNLSETGASMFQS